VFSDKFAALPKTAFVFAFFSFSTVMVGVAALILVVSGILHLKERLVLLLSAIQRLFSLQKTLQKSSRLLF